MSSLQELLELVNQATVDDLLELSRADLQMIAGSVSPADFKQFMIAKNIKIFGGVNAYIDNIFNTNTIQRSLAITNSNLRSSTIQGLLELLTTLQIYPDITPENRAHIERAITQLNQSPAPAAGGRKKRSRKSRKARSS